VPAAAIPKSNKSEKKRVRLVVLLCLRVEVVGEFFFIQQLLQSVIRDSINFER